MYRPPANRFFDCRNLAARRGDMPRTYRQVPVRRLHTPTYLRMNDRLPDRPRAFFEIRPGICRYRERYRQDNRLLISKSACKLIGKLHCIGKIIFNRLHFSASFFVHVVLSVAWHGVFSFIFAYDPQRKVRTETVNTCFCLDSVKTVFARTI